jgi:hypothetical protein
VVSTESRQPQSDGIQGFACDLMLLHQDQAAALQYKRQGGGHWVSVVVLVGSLDCTEGLHLSTATNGTVRAANQHAELLSWLMRPGWWQLVARYPLSGLSHMGPKRQVP